MPYLTQCLDSLLAQTVKDIEVICVNDCSPDNSAEVIQDYIKKDPRVKLVNHTTNKRQGGAWNSGVNAATGEYLCFVDADDWLELDYSEALLNNDTADILCPTKYYSGNSETVNINLNKLRACNNDICLYILLNGAYFISNFIKKDLLVSNDFKFIENNMYHDLIAITLFFYAKKIVVFDKIGYHYRVDNISVQRSMNQKLFWGRLDVVKEADEVCRKISSEKYSEALDFRFYCLFNRNSLIRAFYGYTELPWDKIHRIESETKTTIPNIKRNSYYKERFSDIPVLQRIPIYLFAYCPDFVITVLHKIYLGLRRVIKK